MLLCLTVTTTHSKINGDISLRVPFGLLEGGFQASKLLVSCILLKFVNCRWITGAYSAFNEQKMTDLTDVRLAPCSTFSFVGIYDFGPSYLTHNKRIVNSILLAVIFTSISSRAVQKAAVTGDEAIGCSTSIESTYILQINVGNGNVISYLNKYENTEI